MAECICTTKKYVGKTRRPFRIRVLEDLGSIRNGMDTPVARHVNEHHRGDHTVLTFRGIDQLSMGIRKGNWDQELLKKESRWIYTLKTLFPNGLNEGFVFSPFI